MHRAALVASVGVVALCSRAAFAQGIAGTVVDAESGAPIADATIFLTGTNRTASSGVDGHYRFEGVPPGVARLRAIRVGFASAATSLTVPDSGLGVADFFLSRAAIQLDELVSTASGDTRRRRENGSSVARLSVDSVELAPIQTFAELLTGRVAGLTVQHSSGTTGAGSSVRIRGSNSASLSNEPLYIIDGLWFDNSPASYSIYIGGQSPSRLDEIDPEDLEVLEVTRGPAAAALYGTAAANGVIQVRTRQGVPGPTRWNFNVEGGTIDNVSQFPANYGLWTHSRGFTPPVMGLTSSPFCNLVLVADGVCVADSVAHYNPIQQYSPFRSGRRGRVAVSASGGAPAATYYLSGVLEHESGVYQVNALDRASARANLRLQMAKDLQAELTTSFMHRKLGLLHNDTDFSTFGGPLTNGVDGWPFGSSVDGYGHPTFGYNPIGPDQIFRVLDQQTIDHQTGGLSLTWQPRRWLAFASIAGLDRVSSFDEETIPPNSVFLPRFVTGSRTANQGLVTNYTLNLSGTATFEVARDLVSKAGLGLLYHRDRAHLQAGFGRGLAAGSGSLAGATGDFAVSEIEDENQTFGIVASEQLAWRDRLFLTGALRRDQASAFARTAGSVLYPAISLSWVVGEEPFFHLAPVSSLRLRAAYGESGLAPRPRDAETFFIPVPVRFGGQDVPGITVGNLSDPSLRPERSSELELGLDAGFFRERLGLEATVYRKRSRDALVSVPVPGSVGSAASRLENLGAVANDGVEITVTADLLRGRSLSWRVALTAWGNRNQLLTLGGGVDEVILSATQRHVQGFPLGGYWAVPLDSVRDTNGDGLIGSAEVFFDPSKPARFVGSALPTRGGSFRSKLRLGRQLGLSGLFDYRGGNHTLNVTERTRCVTAVCSGLALADTPLDRKAAAAASLLSGTAFQYAYIEAADFLKLREVALDLAIPDGWARHVGAKALSVTLAGRNLGTWSRYSGADPEADARGQSNFLRADGFSQPQVRYLLLRVSASY